MHSQGSMSSTFSLEEKTVTTSIPDTKPKPVFFHLDHTIDCIAENEEKNPELKKQEYYYLEMADDEFPAFRNSLHKDLNAVTKEQAEEKISENKCKFYFNDILNWCSVGTNGFYPVWLVKTGASGFILCLSLLSGIPQSTLSSSSALNVISNVLVWILSILAAVQWIFMYSSWTEAVKSTLNSTVDGIRSLPDFFKKIFSEAKQHPFDAFKKLLEFLSLQFVTKIINFSAASTVIFFTPSLPTLIPALLILFLSARYCGQVWDDSAKEGVKFWFHWKDHTSIFEQIRQGHYALAFKTVAEALFTILLKALQYFFIAQNAQQLFGVWPSPILTFTCGLVHGLLVNYPVAFKDTLGPVEELDHLLKEKLDQQIAAFITAEIAVLTNMNDADKNAHLKQATQAIKSHLLAVNLNIPEDKTVSGELDRKLETLLKPLLTMTAENNAEQLKLKNQLLQFHADFLASRVLSEGKRKLLTQDSLNMFTVILNALFGGFAGYRLLSPSLSRFIPNWASIPVTITAGSAVVGSLYSRAILATESRKAAAAELNPELKKQDKQQKPSKLAFTLAAAGAISSGLSAIGSAGIIVKDSVAGVTAVVNAATQKMINDTRYAEPFLNKTLKTHAASLSRFFAKHRSAAAKPEVKIQPVKNPVQVNKTRFWDVVDPDNAKKQITNTLNSVRFWMTDRDSKAAAILDRYESRYQCHL